MLEPIRKLVAKQLLQVDNLIARQFGTDVELIRKLSEHIFGSGGKRLRPLVVLLSALSLDYSGERHITLGAVVELIHTATLLHDDVVDKSQKRRGNSTANNLWGDKASVLVGDYIYSRSFQLMVDAGNLNILKILADTSNKIAEGEVWQLAQSQNIAISETDYLIIIDSKTASLFSAAAQIGAMLADAPSQIIEGFKNYGRHLGIAFQLIDDALDYSSSEQDIGKSIGDDFAEGKVTLPLLQTYQNANESVQKIINDAIHLALNKSNNMHLFETVCKAIREHHAITYTMTKAHEHAAKARESLQFLRDSEFKQALFDLTHFAVERGY